MESRRAKMEPRRAKMELRWPKMELRWSLRAALASARAACPWPRCACPCPTGSHQLSPARWSLRAVTLLAAPYGELEKGACGGSLCSSRKHEGNDSASRGNHSARGPSRKYIKVGLPYRNCHTHPHADATAPWQIVGSMGTQVGWSAKITGPV